MTDQTLKILRSTPPSRLASLREIHPKITALESQLRIEPTPKTFNVPKAQARLRELEALDIPGTAPAVADAVRALAAAPSRQQLHRRALADSQAEVYRLEAALGIEHSPQTLSLERLTARIAELADKAGTAAAAAAPVPATTATRAASAPAVPTLAANTMLRADFDKLSFERRNAHMADGGKVVDQAPTHAAGLMATPRLAALCSHLYGGPVSYPDDPNTRAICLAKLRQAGVEVPGVEPDPHKTEVTGFARTFKAALQAKADEFLARK